MEEDPDMDIEENTFIYPRIENIYSDVNIKAEPIDIEEDEFESIEIAESSNDYYMPFPNKIILGSKPSTIIPSEPIPGPSAASDNWEDQDNFFECAECNLLFPTQNELDSHKMASHSFLVARPMNRAIKMERKISISSTSSQSYLEDSSSQESTKRRQKAVKSTSKGAFNKSFPLLYNSLKNKKRKIPFGDINSVSISPKKEITDKGDRLLCKHCDIRFPDEIALIKHTYELLPDTKFKCDICQISFDSKPAMLGHRAIHFKKTKDLVKNNDLLLQCIYCTCFFMYPGFMEKHLLKNHKVTEFTAKSIKYTGKCAICFKKINDYKKYNTHVMTMHQKVFYSRTPFRFDAASGKVKFKCFLCNQIFTSRYAAYKHKAQKHPEHSQKQTFQTVYDKPIKQLTSNSQVSKPEPKLTKSIFNSGKYIPKQNLFKCNKCQIHFVSCSAAFGHSKRCSLAKGDWKCNKCRRTFTMNEKPIHTEQHQHSEKFKVHIVSDKILSKVLCQCPKCQLHFDETAFKDHISADCVATNGEECKICNLKLHADSFAKHRRYHSKHNFSSGDFIVMEFVDTTFQNVSIKEEIEGDFKQKLMYCTTCTCHYYGIKSKLKFHMERRCKTLQKRYCTICGLTFSQKPYLTHMYFDHGALNLKLDDIKFVRIQDSKVINPVMPNFFQCEKCEIRFNSPLVKSSHSCSRQIFVKCSKCSQKYDSVTYDIHLTFHNYAHPIKEDPLPLKFYSCVACNYGFQNYDSIVEHCQNHYNGSENLATRRCKICKLYYAEGHKILHSNRAKFEIFKFDHEKLFTEDWLDGFNSLPKDVVDDILSKSVYGALRNVRLKLLVDGPTERTLYKCVQCELNFEQNDVVKHTSDSCSNTPHFECSSCTAAFRTRNAKSNHMNIHVIYGDDITFREIIFNNESDKELNAAFRNGRQKESLKFRKCQQCKLLIKISDYEAHISAHSGKGEVKQYKFRRSNKVLSYKLFKPVNFVKKQYTLYKCRLCNAGIMVKANMLRHTCLSPDKYEKCDKCSLNILAWNIKRHIAMHRTIPKFVMKNISIIEFELLDNRKKLVKKRRRYSSDDDASTGSQVNISVTKTYDTRKIVGRPFSDNLSEYSQDSVVDDASIDTSVTLNTYAKKYIKKSFIQKANSVSDSEESQSDLNCTSEKKSQKSGSKVDTESWRIDMKNKLYQCERCYFCFVHKQLLVSHLLECDDSSLSETPLICDRCDIVFHPSMLSFHEKLHELVKQNPVENYFYLINISTNGVGTHNEKRWLYKCKLCDVQYLNTKSLETHFSSDHFDSGFVNCEMCGMKFTQISRTRHMRIQHNEGKWSIDDLHIEVTQKKIVDIGEINLRAFVKGNSGSNNSNVDNKEIVELRHSIDLINVREVSTAVEKSVVSPEQHKDHSNTANLLGFSTEKEDEIDSDVSQGDLEKIDHNLYKCIKCSNHYISKLSFIRHISVENHKESGPKCDICGLIFSRQTLKMHKSMQHGRLKLDLKDFVINSDQETENNKPVTELMVNSELLNDSDISLDTSSIESSLSQSQNERLSEEMKKIKIKSGVGDAIDNHLYKCVECSVYYTNRRTLMLHIVLKKHKPTEFLRCDICGLLFGSRSLAKHRTVQHLKLNLTRKDFIITDIFGTRLLDDESNYTIDEASTDSLTIIKFNKELKAIKKPKIKVTGKKAKTIFKLYQCKDCRICVQKTDRKLHVCCSDIQKKQCIRCCLFFRNTDIVEHKQLHRKYHDLSRKNFTLIRFGHRTTKIDKIYKCVSCSTHFLSLSSLEWHMNAWNHQTKRDYCKICGIFFGRHSLSRHNYIHHTKLNLTVEQFNIIYVSDTHNDPSSTESIEVANNLNNSNNKLVSEPDVKTIKKLFKCVECDVYFLTRASYYHHIYKHKKLDATEYIDCNICDFQFLNESLGIHMKTHKDKSFCLDKLLIEEYQPNNPDSPKIEFYFAKDSVNSKLVSTTTLFDNDDETVLDQTDGQLSVIDSTSDEMPKTKTGEVHVDASLYPNENDSSLVEDATNPNVEMPKIDDCVKSSD